MSEPRRGDLLPNVNYMRPETGSVSFIIDPQFLIHSLAHSRHSMNTFGWMDGWVDGKQVGRQAFALNLKG